MRSVGYHLVPAGAVPSGGLPRPAERGDRLCFDSSGYRPEREEEGEEPARPQRSPDEDVLLTMLFVMLVLAALLPISAAGLVDLVHYLFG